MLLEAYFQLKNIKWLLFVHRFLICFFRLFISDVYSEYNHMFYIYMSNLKVIFFFLHATAQNFNQLSYFCTWTRDLRFVILQVTLYFNMHVFWKGKIPQGCMIFTVVCFKFIAKHNWINHGTHFSLHVWKMQIVIGQLLRGLVISQMSCLQFVFHFFQA